MLRRSLIEQVIEAEVAAVRVVNGCQPVWSVVTTCRGVRPALDSAGYLGICFGNSCLHSRAEVAFIDRSRHSSRTESGLFSDFLNSSLIAGNNLKVAQTQYALTRAGAWSYDIQKRWT